MKIFYTQLAIVVLLLVIVEFVFKFTGHKAGVLSNEFYPPDTVIYEPRFISDAVGISKYDKNSPHLPNEYVINNDGFLSSFDFNKHTIDSIKATNDVKVIAIIGDSYTEGCCASPHNQSFVSLLTEHRKDLLVLNFGVGATDLIQYKLITENYINYLKPDLTIIAFYLGNDIAYYKRPVVPNIPHTYPIKDYKWLSSTPLPWLNDFQQNEPFKTHLEAYNFYFHHYTLFGENRTTFEKIIRKSIVLSKIYLGIKDKFALAVFMIRAITSNMYSLGQKVEITNELLVDITQQLNDNKLKNIVVAIPSPSDTKKEINLSKHYKEYFINTNCVFPNITDYSTNDYDGLSKSNHFNNSGHFKFYKFIETVITNEL